MRTSWIALAVSVALASALTARAQAVGQSTPGYVAPRTYQQVAPGIPPEMVEFRGAERANLGVTLSDSNSGKVWIRAVHPGSPADQAGLRANDQIVSIDGKIVQTYLDVIRLVNQKGASDNIQIQFLRNGLPGMLTAALGAQYSGLPAGTYAHFPATETESGYRGLPSSNPPPAGYAVPNTLGPYNK